MRFKSYSMAMILSFIFIFLYNLIIWNLFTKEFLEVKKGAQVGDLMRMSYLKGLRFEKFNNENLLKKHLKFQGDFDDIDVITIGDSFSNGGGGGLNPFYQDFIATKYNFKVLNIMPISEGYIETIIALNKIGFLEKLKPEYIILQSIERKVINRLAKEVDWEIKVDQKKITKQLFVKYKNNLPEYFFFNSSNIKAPLYNLFYKFDDNAYFSKAYLANLKSNMFNTKIQNKLLFFSADLNSTNFKKNNIQKLNSNLNKISNILNKKNIKLVFMPNVNKYNLYSEYIIDNSKYPKSNFFEEMRIQNKNYIFIDTKKILNNLLDKGTINVYFPDDTHWTDIASSEVVDHLPFDSK